jgi:hypothetical protein
MATIEDVCMPEFDAIMEQVLAQHGLNYDRAKRACDAMMQSICHMKLPGRPRTKEQELAIVLLCVAILRTHLEHGGYGARVVNSLLEDGGSPWRLVSEQ